MDGSLERYSIQKGTYMVRMEILVVILTSVLLVNGVITWNLAAGESSLSSEAAKVISDALVLAKDQIPAERLQTFQAISKQVQEICPNNVLVAEQLQAADSAEAMEKALRASQAILAFQLKKEAELPVGFPEPTPVGEIQVKEYPAYRLARTSSAKDSGFFKLFAHITLNRIAMTAPVEMTYRTNAEKKPEQIDMAFLYGDKEIGKVGDKFGSVTVQDVPAMTTVSIGLKGDSERKKLVEIEDRLEEWLAKQAPDYERARSLRVMGYNSPQVPADLRYYEVELPIKRK